MKKRGVVRTQTSTFVGLWIPAPLLKKLDGEIDQKDSDRSKFIRIAVREKLARAGVQIEEKASA